jgi:hypothetical protein
MKILANVGAALILLGFAYLGWMYVSAGWPNYQPFICIAVGVLMCLIALIGQISMRQYSLSSIVIFTLIAALFLGLNLRSFWPNSPRPKELGWGIGWPVTMPGKMYVAIVLDAGCATLAFWLALILNSKKDRGSKQIDGNKTPK